MWKTISNYPNAERLRLRLRMWMRRRMRMRRRRRRWLMLWVGRRECEVVGLISV